MKVLVLPVDRWGCGLLRMKGPGEALRRAGHDVTVVDTADRRVRLHMSGEEVTRVELEADVVVFQRVTHSRIAQAVSVLRKQGVAVVVDIDDDLTAVHPSNPAWAGLHPKNEGRRLSNGTVSMSSWRNLNAACRAATLVTVSTPALLPVYAAHGRGVVLDNYLPSMYDNVPHEDSDLIGWPASLHSHPNDPDAAGGAISRLVAEGARFEVRGDPSGCAAAFGLPEEPVSAGNVPLEQWPESVGRIGIGIAPLADTRFNRSKCVDSSMRVCTHRGILEAREIQTGDQVWRDGWKTVEATEHGPRTEGVLITTEGGYQLRLTLTHRMKVNGTWTYAEDIRVGDAMAMAPEPVGATEVVRAPWPADSRMNRRAVVDYSAYLTAPEGPRVDITPRWGRFLGAFVGDGSCGQATQLEISCDGQDQDWIDLLMEDFRAFGFSPTTETKTMFNGTVLRRRGVRVASAHLLRVLNSFGLTKDRENGRPIRSVCVPEVIWRSPREVIAEFLAGYFEADGHCTSSGVGLVSKNEQVIRDVQRLLIAFGIRSRVGPRIHKAQNGFSGEYWHLTMGRAAADVFAKEIGFRSARKSARLSEIVSKPHSNAYRPMAWEAKVTSVEPCEVDPVDIQVEGSEYIASGFVSHNSRLKPLEMSACGVPWVASPRPEYARLHALGAGMLADRPRTWYRALKQLRESETLRRELSEAGRAVAAGQRLEDHSYRWAEAWEKALRLQRGVTAPSVVAGV